MRQCPAWAYAAQRDACFDAGAKQNAPHESEVRGVHPGSAWWVYATKKIPSENENSGFGFDLFSFLHRDFSSFTSGCPVLVKEDDPEKTA